MPSSTWYVGSYQTTYSPFVVVDFWKDAQTTITTPNTYTIEILQWYAAAEVASGIYIKTELYVGGDLVARTTEKQITATSVTSYGFSRTANNGGGPWAYTVTGSTTFTFRIWFRNATGGGKTCTYAAWQDFGGDYVPYGVISVSYPGSGARVWNGSSWVKRPVKVWNGSSWVRRPVKVWNGSSWVTH